MSTSIRLSAANVSDAGFIEPYEDRKVRRGHTIQNAARAARAADFARYEQRLNAERVEAEAKRSKAAAAQLAIDLAAILAAPLTTSMVGRPKVILREIADKHGLAVVDLTGPSRLRSIAHARQEAMWTMRRDTALSSPQIAQLLGGRNHTTVLWGINQHQRRLDAIASGVSS